MKMFDIKLMIVFKGWNIYNTGVIDTSYMICGYTLLELKL